MSTPLSSSTAYAAPSDLIVYHDSSLCCELVSDTGTPAALSSFTGNSNAVAIVMMKRASGDVEAAALCGGRYTPTDLAALTGVGLDYLKGLTCDLAFWHLWKRRHKASKPEDVPGVTEALEALAMLRTGERIFGLQEVADAGIGSLQAVALGGGDCCDGAAGTLPPGALCGKSSRVSDVANRYFGRRSNRMGCGSTPPNGDCC